MSGVPSSLYSGRGPSASVLNRHATSSLLKFAAFTSASGEKCVLARSAAYDGHSPLAVLGRGACCACGLCHSAVAAAKATPTSSEQRISNRVAFMEPRCENVVDLQSA